MITDASDIPLEGILISFNNDQQTITIILQFVYFTIFFYKFS